MAQTDEMKIRVVRDVIAINSGTGYFDGRKLFADDANVILYDKDGSSSGGKQVGIVLHLAYKDPINHSRIYTSIYNGKLYTMTLNTATLNRVTWSVTETSIG